MSCPDCGGEIPPGGHCASCSAVTADDAASKSTAPVAGPVPGPPPRGLGSLRVEPGQRFGDRYTLIEEIGAGGMGRVYKAIDVRLGKTVALKLVRAGSSAQEQTIERFRRELTLAQEVTHPNVCRVYDLGEIDGTLFISMEYVEGQSLDDLIQSVGTLSTKQTIAIGRQVCAGLDAIHSRQIVHRDLKPSNLMVDRSGHAILMDFGLAYHHGHDRLTGEGAILGTLAYLSPEQAHGQATDARTDLYAVGLVLFEMLTGRRAPGDGGTAPLALRDPGERCPPPSRFSPDVPAALSTIVLRCLERDPSSRYASARELDADLARLAASLSSGVSAGRIRISTPRGRLTSAVATGVVALALAGVAGWWAAHRPHRAGGHPVIAVLPLQMVGGSPDDHLGVGMADTLIAHLAGIPSVTVVSRTATGGSDEARGQVRRLAHELGADYVVSGSVQRMERRMHVTATLVRPDDSVAWGGDYDGTLDDVFGLQRRLAEGVAAALAVDLTPADRARLARPPTKDAAAFADFSAAQALLERPDVPGNVSRAIEGLRSAIARDPRFALAHAGLGQAYWIRYQETKDEASVASALGAITEALRLDPDQPLTRLALARLYQGRGQIPQAVEELRGVLATRPSNDEAHRVLGDLLLSQGQTDEGLAELARAVELRPASAENHRVLGRAEYQLGRYPEALREFTRVTEIQPDNPRGYQGLGAVYQAQGQNALALESYRRANAIRPDARAAFNLGTLLAAEGRDKEAAAAFEEALRLEPTPVKAVSLGRVYARLGQRAPAEAQYARAVELSQSQLRVNPNDAQALSTLAWAESLLGRRPAAERHLAEALALNPSSAEVLYRKAVVEVGWGETTAGILALKEAIRHGWSAPLARQDLELASVRDHPGFRELVDNRRP